MIAIIKEIGESTEQLFRKPIEATIQVAGTSGGAENKTLLLYYSNVPNRVNKNDSSWSSTKATVDYDSKKYEITIFKIDDPNATDSEKKNNKNKICRFHYKGVESSTEKQLQTTDITDCKGWIGLRDKESVDKSKPAAA